MRILNKFSHAFCFVVGRSVFKLFCHFRVEGEEALKNVSRPLIVAFNHSSFLDPFFVMAAFSPITGLYPVRFATWYRHYYKFLPFLWLEGSFPVKKGSGLENSLAEGVDILKDSGVIGIAPEEKRRHLGRPRHPRRGVAFLALKTQTPVLPVYIKGNIGLSAADFFFRRRQITIVVGQPIPPPRGTSLKDFAHLVMERVYELK